MAKAYSVSDSNGNVGFVYIIFAETRAKAIHYALNNCDGTFDWYQWTEMRALRVPSLDKYYKGKPEMEWDDMDDRVAMVKEAGFYCSYEIDVTLSECEECPAHQWCDRYERIREIGACNNELDDPADERERPRRG